MRIAPKFLNSNKFANLAQTTVFAVGTETALKAAGRPTFTMIDKNTDKETRKYSATKEFIYQALCFGIYMTFVPLIFKRSGYKIAKKVFKDNADVQTTFADFDIKKLITRKNGKTKEIKGYKNFMHDYETRKKNFEDIPEAMQKIKGGIEGVSIVGSVIGLTILAPQISHVILHPIMRAIGLEKKESSSKPAVQAENQFPETGRQPLEKSKDKINANA